MDANHQEKYHDQIDAYLREELSIEEKALFEELLKNNPELLHEFKIHQELFALTDESAWIDESFTPDKEDVNEVESYFKSKEAKQLKDTIIKAKNAYQKNNSSSWFKNKVRVSILMAASFIVFIVLYTFNSKSSPQDLYVLYSEWKDLPSLTSRSDENQLAEGQKMFEQKKYQESYNLFKNYIENKDQTLPSLFIYAGLSALELNKYEEAVYYFDSLISSDAVDQSKGYWYKALVYLKQDRKNKAIPMLENILLDEGNYNFDEAKTILKKLQ